MIEVRCKLIGSVECLEVSAGLRLAHNGSVLKREVRIHVWTCRADHWWQCRAIGIGIQERFAAPWLPCDVIHESSDKFSMESRLAHLLGGRCTNLITQLFELVEAIQKRLGALGR